MANEVVAPYEVVEIKLILKDFAKTIKVKGFVGIELFFGHFL